jgi:hypothetical protein
MKSDQRGMLWVDRVADRRSSGILVRDFWGKRRRLFIFAFPPWRSDLQRPAAVKGARLSGAASAHP